jgi:predicted ArsR family transcriptional regulator
LDILQRDHLVSSQQSHKKLGRPEFLYSLTEKGHESGYRDYQTLLALLLTDIKSLSCADLANKDGPELLDFLMVSVSDRINGPSAADSPLPLDDRLSQLEQVLTKNGYEPQIDRHVAHVEVRLCNCPFRAVALCQESICLSDQRLISNILGIEPVRASSIRNGDLSCSYIAKLDS